MKRDILDWTLREAVELCNAGQECLDCPAYREGYGRKRLKSCLFDCLTGTTPRGWYKDDAVRLYTREEVKGARAIKRLYPSVTKVVKKEHGIELRAGGCLSVIEIKNDSLFSTLEVGECLEIEDVLEGREDG